MNTINANDLRRVLLQAGIPNGAIYLGDGEYQAPKANWLLDEFDDWFRSMLTALDLGYSTDMWDCEDFSDLYAALARICHRKTPEATAAGLPVGILWYAQAPDAGHAIVVAYTSDRGLIFIEPQIRGKEVTLDQSETKTCWLCKI